MIIHKHKTVGQVIKRLLLTAFIMTLIFVAAGVIYVYITGRENVSKQTPAIVETTKPIVDQPTMPAANAPNGASVQYLETPVKPGENSTINIHTGPYSACTIVVAYGNVVSKDTGLGPKKADIHGIVSWTWTVDKTAAIGKWPVKVTCDRNKMVGYVEGYLEVTK